MYFIDSSSRWKSKRLTYIHRGNRQDHRRSPNKRQRRHFIPYMLTRIIGRPRETFNSHITTQGSEVKALLINHFDTPVNEVQLTERLLSARFTSAVRTCEHICKCLCRLNNKIKYNNSYSSGQKVEILKTKSDIAKSVFINKCPEPLRVILHSYKTTILEDAFSVLVERGYIFVMVKIEV